MAIVPFDEIRGPALTEAARRMLVAAKTAPKGRGIENLVYATVDGAEKEALAAKMDELSRNLNIPFFSRDANNLRRAEIVVLIGSRIAPLGLPLCGMCGFKNCEEKRQHPTVPCLYNTVNLGIAVGAAASVAADLRVDNRIMYTAGRAALELGFFGPEIFVVYGIPLAATEKNIFFDRT